MLGVYIRRSTIVIIIFIIASYLLFCSSVTIYCADVFLVNNIYFEGLQRVTVGAMLFNMQVRIGEIATDENIRNTISTLFYTGNFEEIRVFSDKDSLVIQVKERPTIASIIFLGNKEVKDDLLKKKLDAQGIMVGKVLNRTTIANIEMGIEDFYCSIGKYRAMVKTIVTLLPCNMVDLKLVLIEGEYAKINNINIVGNHIFTTNELMLSLKLNDEVYWWNVVSDSKYNKNKISRYIEKLRNFYLDRGYACLDIFSAYVNITQDKNSIYITININEGAKYKLSGIFLNLNIAESSNFKEFIEIETIKNFELYNINKIKKIEKNINKLLGCYGYAYPNVLTQHEINYIDKTIKLHVNIDTGNRFYVRYINLYGNNITKDLVLRSEIQQIEGTLLSSYLVDQGRERLNSIGYFDTVDTDLIIVNSYDKVDVIYNVKERNTGSIYAGIGLGTERCISFQCGIQQDNLFGTGNLVSLHGKRNCYKTYTEFYITYPYITLDGVSLSCKIVYNYFKAANLSDYNLRIYSFSSTLTFPINYKQTLSIGLDYVHYYLTNIKKQVASYITDKFIIIDNNTIINSEYNFIKNKLFLKIGWCYNNLDSCYLPNSGASASLLGTVTFPYSKSKYFNIIFDIKNYIPLKENKNFIIMGRASVGYTIGSIPFLDKIYAGWVRGFSNSICKKKSEYYKYNSSTYLVANSYINQCFSNAGNAMTIISSAELIFPTPFLIKNYVRTSFFIDSGTVLDTYSYNKEATRATGIIYSDHYKIRISCGISVQWMSQLGPIVLSYAKPIKIYTGDKLEQFQFNIGKIW